MKAPDFPHPSDRTLSDYGLGKLDDELSSSVHEHLEGCQECRQRVAGFTSDSFLGRFRVVRKPTDRSTPGGTLNGATLSFAGAKPTSPPPPTDTLPPGLADHPDYEIKRELGRGGMGVVYLAHNAMMGRDEVLKVMGRHIMDRPGVLERFQREIRAVAKFRHPNIVTAYHAFRIEGGLVFSMEYVEGLDLARLVKTKGPLAVAHAAYFAHQAALGLQHAHEKGLIHRDIKPHNLMLTHDGKARLVKVLDFGLAKATREEKIDGGLTSEGQALGTPDYIAPEQIVNAMSADIRADLYSLGGTLFYLLTGRPPFQANSLYDMYQAHISRDAEPLNLIRPEVPAELAALVAKMMAKDPGRRFQTPGEVAQALTPFFKSKAVKVQPEVSQTETIQARPLLRMDEKPAPTGRATNVGLPVVRVQAAAEPLDIGWDRLLDAQEPETVLDKPLRAMSPRRPRWLWPAVSAASLLGVLLIAWLAGVFKVKTADGVIVLENVPQDAEVQVDGKKITFTWAGDDKPLEIGIVPGEHRVRVEKDGFKTFGETVTIAKAGREEVTVRLEPIVALPSLAKAAQQVPEAEKVPPTPGENTPTTTLGVETTGGVALRPGATPDADKALTRGEVPRAADKAPGNLPAEALRAEVKPGLTPAPAPLGPGLHAFVVDGDWSVEGVNLIQRNTDAKSAIVLLGDAEYEEFDLSFRATVVRGDRFLAIFGYTGPRENWHVESGDQDGRQTSIQWYHDGDGDLVEHEPVGVARNREYEMLIQVRKGGCRVIRDKQTVIVYEDRGSGKGRIGLGTWRSSAKFKDIVIRTRDGKKIWNGPFSLIPRAAQVPPPIDLAGPEVAGKVAAATPTSRTAEAKPSSRDPRVARIAALEAVLDKRVPMKYPGGVPIWKLVDDIKKATKEPGGPVVPIYVDPQGLIDADKAMDSTMSIEIEGQPLRITLRRALKQLGLDYCNKEGLLFISAVQMARNETNRPGKVPTDDKPVSKAVVDALEKPIPLRFPKETKIGDVVIYLRKAAKTVDGSGIAIDVDPQGLIDADKAMDSTISIDLESMPLRVTLNLLLRQLGMDYYVEDGILTISSRSVFPPSMKNQK